LVAEEGGALPEFFDRGCHLRARDNSRGVGSRAVVADLNIVAIGPHRLFDHIAHGSPRTDFARTAKDWFLSYDA
jgi:hypothetical protein